MQLFIRLNIIISIQEFNCYYILILEVVPFVTVLYEFEPYFKYTETELLIHATLEVAPFFAILYKAEPYYYCGEI